MGVAVVMKLIDVNAVKDGEVIFARFQQMDLDVKVMKIVTTDNVTPLQNLACALKTILELLAKYPK
jgi:hypothetical protein